MIAIKYTTELTTALPPDASCGKAASMLKALAAAVVDGNAAEDALRAAVEIYEKKLPIPEFSAQDMKVSLPVHIVAQALYSTLDKAKGLSFSTKMAWPFLDGSIIQKVLVSDFLIAIRDCGRVGINVPVLRILQLATESSQTNGAGEVDDITVYSYLCSYYSSFDERFQLAFYPTAFSKLASPDAVLFEASSALSDGVERTAVKSLSGTSSWLGMLVDSSTPIPSLLSDFMKRTGQSSGIAGSGNTGLSSLLVGANGLDSTCSACLEMEMPKVYDVSEEFTQQTVELIMADSISLEHPASTASFVQAMMINMGYDRYTMSAWDDYCSAVEDEFLSSVSGASEKPKIVSLLPEAQRALVSAMVNKQDVNLRLALASTAACKFNKEFSLGGAPDHVVLSDVDIDKITVSGKLAPSEAEMEARKMSQFSVPPIYQDLFLINMQKHNRTFIEVEDIYAPFAFDSTDAAFLKVGQDRNSLHSGITLDASELLAGTAALFRAMVSDSVMPDALTIDVYGECLTFVCEAKKHESSPICNMDENWLTSLGTVPFDPRKLGMPIDSANSVVVSNRPFQNDPNPRHEAGVYRQKRRGRLLDQFCTDMVELARKGEIGEFVIGREAAIENVEAVLLRRDKSNPLLLAPAGAGKTAVVEGLAKKIADGEGGSLSNFGVYSLDLTSLVADGPSSGVMGERVRGIMTEAIEDNAIIFIDEIHMLEAVGTGDFNVSNIMKPFLARHGLKVIGATTEREYNYSIAKDKALDRRFSPIHLPKLEFEDIVEILKAKSQIYGKHHGVVYADGTANIIALLAEDYMGSRESPDRELDILDVAGSVAAGNGELEVKEESIVNAVKLLTSNRSIKTRKDVARELMEAPSSDDVDTAFPNVAAQRAAKETIMRRIAESKLDISSRDKPRNVFMFVGGSGVGKSYMACEMAPLLDAKKDDVLQLSLGEYQDKASHTRLVGASPQYVGYQEGGVLTSFAKAHPAGIVILDEIDKCAFEIRDMFLGIFDTGFVQAANGDVIDCRSMTFVCTANTGHGTQKKASIGFGTGEDASKQELDNIKEALKDQFGEPLLNRMDEIVIFDDLTDDDLVEICKISYRKLVDKMSRRYGIDITECYPESQLEEEARAKFAESKDKLDARTAWGPFEKEIVPKAIELLG